MNLPNSITFLIPTFRSVPQSSEIDTLHCTSIEFNLFVDFLQFVRREAPVPSLTYNYEIPFAVSRKEIIEFIEPPLSHMARDLTHPGLPHRSLDQNKPS